MSGSHLPAPTLLASGDDAYGRMMLDYLGDGWSVGGVLERSDGYILPDLPVQTYFAPVTEWPLLERDVLDSVTGRVLDLGCGAGRHALYLQDKGLDVLALDNSAGAIEACNTRGVRDARVVAVNHLSRELGRFDTVLMMCTNFGLAGDRSRTRSLLQRLAQLTNRKARIIADTLDPHLASRPEHREYMQRNIDRGRLPGQLTIRLRYRMWRTNWFDQLYVSPSELEELVWGTGWRIADLLSVPDPGYLALLAKTPKG